MKILYISEYFSPVSYIAAVRSTKITKYLSRMGHEVTVLTRDWGSSIKKDPNLIRDEREIANVIRVNNSKLYLKTYNKVFATYKKSSFSVSSSKPASGNMELSPKKSIKQKIKSLIKERMEKQKNIDYAKQAIKALKHYGANNFDIVISSYGPFSSHLIGMFVKKRSHCRWIADFRDPISYCLKPSYITGWAKRFRNKVIRNADKIVCVSAGCADSFPESSKPKTIVITNGFDPDDIITSSSDNRKNNRFELAYTGQLYMGKRKLNAVFRCVKELINEGKIDSEKIKIHYAGNGFDELLRQSREYDLDSILIDHGFVGRDEAIKIQADCDVLLLASWNSVGNTGVITGKLFEYLMMNKPIVCTVSGNLGESELKQIITNAQSGVCFEEANTGTDYPMLKSYMLERYLMALGHSQDNFIPDRQYINKFTYERKAQEFENIIEKSEK